MRPRWLVPVCISALAGGIACERSDARAREPSPLLSAPAAHEVPVDVARAVADAGALREALVRPHRAGAPALGAHTLTASSTLRVRESGAEVEKLEVSEAFEMDGSGAYHVLASNSQDHGREIWFRPAAAKDGGADEGGTLWIRPGFGKYHRRGPSEPGEPARLLDETFASFGASLDLVASGVGVSDASEVTVAGRKAHKVTLSLGKTARARTETLPQRAWREGVVVQALTGEVVLDDASGLLLSGTLSAVCSFVRDGRTFELAVEAKHEVKDIGAAVALAFPGDADSVATPVRSHEFEEREELLHGIAPPGKRGPVPSDSTAAPARPAPPSPPKTPPAEGAGTP